MRALALHPLEEQPQVLFLLCTGLFAFLASFNDSKARRFLNMTIITYSILIVIHSTSAFKTITSNYFFDFASNVRNFLSLPWQHTVYSGPQNHI